MPIKNKQMNKKINGSYTKHATKLGPLSALALALVIGLAAGSANAACTVVFSAANVQMGNVSVAALRVSNVPGYRSIGTKNQTMNVTCDVSQPALRVQLGGLVQVIGKPLVRWGTVGAMQVRALSASASGTPVNIKLESLPTSIFSPGVEIIKDEVLNFDLSNVPVKDRKSFSLQFQLTGLLPEGYAVTSQLVLESSMSAQLLAVQ